LVTKPLLKIRVENSPYGELLNILRNLPASGPLLRINARHLGILRDLPASGPLLKIRVENSPYGELLNTFAT